MRASLVLQMSETAVEISTPEPKLLPFGMMTLSANLMSILGEGAEAGYLRITLCGFGPVIPSVPGTGMLADAGIPQLIGPQVGSTALLVNLLGNAVINPANTFYEISVLDANQNVIQSANYILSGSGTQDLSQLIPLTPPGAGYQPGGLVYAPCTGVVPGTVYTASGPVIAVSYNGIFLRAGQALPALSYTAAGEVITLNFTTQIGDRIDAICLALP
jgi:hypothetical protein